MNKTVLSHHRLKKPPSNPSTACIYAVRRHHVLSTPFNTFTMFTFITLRSGVSPKINTKMCKIVSGLRSNININFSAIFVRWNKDWLNKNARNTNRNYRPVSTCNFCPSSMLKRIKLKWIKPNYIKYPLWYSTQLIWFMAMKWYFAHLNAITFLVSKCNNIFFCILMQ